MGKAVLKDVLPMAKAFLKSRPFGVIPPIAERWSRVSLTLWL